MQISADLALIGRCFLALLWGGLWALFLQYHRMGHFLVKERTWLTVVAGVGVDLLIAFGGDWWTVVAVIAFSSFGIIGRSLINEQRPRLPSGYKVLWALEDAIDVTLELVGVLEDLVEVENGKRVAALGRALRLAHRLNELARDARRGEYNRR